MLCSHRCFVFNIIYHKTLAARAEAAAAAAAAVATAIIHLCSLSKLWVSFNVKIKIELKNSSFKCIFFCVDKWLTQLLCAAAATVVDTALFDYYFQLARFSLMNSYSSMLLHYRFTSFIHSFVHSQHITT